MAPSCVKPKISLSIICGALVLTTVACSGSSDVALDAEEPSSAERPVVTVAATGDFANPTTSPEPLNAPEAGVEIERSPIDELLGFETDPYRLSARYAEQAGRYVDDVDSCMDTEGFDGFRAETPELPRPEDLVADGPEFDLATIGYGPSIVLRSRFDAIESGASPVDEEQVELSGAGRYLADNPETDEDAFFTQLNECTDEAWQRHPPPTPSYPQQLAEEIGVLRTEARQTEPVQRAWAEWASCLQAEGYDVAGRQDMRELVEEAGLPLFEQLNAWAATTPGLSDQELETFASELDNLASFERTLVELDLDCAAASRADEITRQEIDRAEAAWIDANAERVELLLAADEG